LPSDGVDAAVQTGGCDPRGADHLAVSSVHGAPVHLGHPHSIGIADLAKPDYGDAYRLKPMRFPVFWACA